MAGRSALKTALEQLCTSRSTDRLANDPLAFCHRFHDPADQEIAALIAAVFAYGSVKVIRGSLDRIFTIIGSSPTGFIDNLDPQQQRSLLSSFKHRFNSGDDLTALFWAIRQMRQQEGNIERFFCRFHDPAAATVEQGLNGFCAAVLALDYRPVFGADGLPDTGNFRFLFPSPDRGSACKRLCMFLRWVVRPADGIDLGLWHQVQPEQLIIPVDRHIERIARLLGLTGRRSADWCMACEITTALRRFDRRDPVKYDFSLCHLGISEGCNGRHGDACHTCPVAGFCASGSMETAG